MRQANIPKTLAEKAKKKKKCKKHCWHVLRFDLSGTRRKIEACVCLQCCFCGDQILVLDSNKDHGKFLSKGISKTLDEPLMNHYW